MAKKADDGNSRRVLLGGISGRVEPGQVMAIMGPSGSGKSTLLNVLAGRLAKGGSLSGQVSVNGSPREEASFRAMSAYSLQDDMLFSNFTVRETLETAAKLRMRPGATAKERREAVDRIIDVMGLAKAADTYIGGENRRGVSGGERKRVAVAVEVINNPSLIFLDEPTSGLDSFQAQSVMQAMLNLANRGHTVVSVIHQPRSSIYKMFDRLQLISEGRVMYTGDAAHAAAYFAGHGYACPPEYNAADYFLDIVSMDYRTAESREESSERLRLLSALHENGGDAESAHPTTLDVESGGRTPSDEAGGRSWDSYPKLEHSGIRPASLLRQAAVLGRRAFLQTIRDHLPNTIQAVQTAIIVAILGALWGGGSSSGMRLITVDGLLFFIVTDTALASMFPTATAFPSERAIVNRERDAGAYVALPYFITKVLVDTPFKLLPKTVGFAALYWWVGLAPAAATFFTFLLILVVEYIACVGAGYMVGGWVKTFQAANAFAPIIMMFWILFGGFLIPLSDLPEWTLFMAYLNPVAWSKIAITLNELDGLAADQYRALLPKHLSFISKWEALAWCALVGAAYYILAMIGLIVTRNRYQPLSTMRVSPSKASSGEKDAGTAAVVMSPQLRTNSHDKAKRKAQAQVDTHDDVRSNVAHASYQDMPVVASIVVDVDL